AVNASSNQEVPDLTGEWSIIGNGFYGKFYVVNQDGGEFTGTVNYNGGNIEKLINGSLSDDIFYFTRMWDSGTLWQDYKGELTISESGVAKITGTFSQTGGGYVYSWTATKVNPINSTIIVETEQEEMTIGKSTAEAFESGARISWVSSNGIGYRLFRSTSNTSLGISVTDFYLTSTSYADVNVNPNTTYYYTVKPVLSEANPYQGKEEKLGATLATFTVKTGESVYKQGSLKNFIMLQLENPYLTMNGVREEIDVGRGTTPIIISGRTMVPIRAVVEAMGGTVGWDDGTQKITLNARGNIVEMWLNKTDIIINGTSMQMDVAPISKNGRTFVPVRFAAENLNCKVDWINSTKEAVIIFED
ncbi:MAG: stalk domain-containing protein, partial [Sedimentibacter sp.]